MDALGRGDGAHGHRLWGRRVERVLAGERDPVRSIEAYAEKVCINDDVRWEIRGSWDSRVGISFFREWETVAAAERDLKSHRWRLRALTPPAGLGRFHAAALDSLRDALDELGEQTTPGGTVRVGTIPMGFPAVGAYVRRSGISPATPAN